MQNKWVTYLVKVVVLDGMIRLRTGGGGSDRKGVDRMHCGDAHEEEDANVTHNE